MKLQLVCLFLVLLTAATGNLSAFKIQVEPERDLASLETDRAETVAESPSALQMLLLTIQRSKRFDTGSPSQFNSRDCSFCCQNGGCGICCRF